MLFSDVINNLAVVCSDAHQRFMHPSASGNVSVAIDDLPPQSECFTGSWENLSAPLSNLRGAHLLISTSGSQIGHIARRTEEALGVVEFNKEGDAYRKLWGFKGYSQRPTSELDTHVRIQNVDPGSVIHNHPTATNALMFAGIVNDSAMANKILWQGSTEGVAYLQGGLEVLPWCVPGTEQIGKDTAAALEAGAGAVLWHRHGLVANGKNIDEAYGKVLTVEHAMLTIQMALAAVQSIDQINWLEKQQLDQLVKKFSLAPRKDIWDGF